MVFPWRFQEARKLHLWVQMVPGNQLFSSAVPESTNQVRELFIITGNLILMTVKGPDNQLFSASVYQEISFGVLNLGYSEEDAKKAVEDVIAELEITPFRHKPTHALSGGQKKQVSIADILVMKPDIIILDEPAAALDPKHTTMVNQIVNRMTKAGITVFMATHDVNYAYEWADQVILFHQGKVLMQGAPEEVFSNPRVLEKTNLEPPAVLELFHSLCQKQILKTTLPLPKNLKTLEKYISDTNINTTQ